MNDGLNDIKNGVSKIAAWFAHLIDRLTSRKFLLTVAAGIPLALNQQWGELVTLISVFIGAEGAADAAQRYQEAKVSSNTSLLSDISQIANDDADDDVDKDKIIAGEVPM